MGAGFYYSVHCTETIKRRVEDKLSSFGGKCADIGRNAVNELLGHEIEEGYVLLIDTLPGEHRAKKLLVVEPHPDDGVFSAGGSLLNMTENGVEVSCFCVFSKGGEKEEVRHRENILVWERIFKSRAEFAQLMDAAFRSGEQNKNAPQAYAKTYFKAMNSIERKICEYKPDIVLGPLAVGEHIDHVITNRALINIYKEKKNFELWFFEDFPYANSERYFYIKPLTDVRKEIGIASFYNDITSKIHDKATLYMAYLSQHSKKRSEIYDVLLKYGEAIGLEGMHMNRSLQDGRLYERLWRCD